MKHLLGGKGVSLAEMTILGIPLQPGLQRFLRGRRGSKRANLAETNKRWMSFHLKSITLMGKQMKDYNRLLTLIERQKGSVDKQILDGNKDLIKSRYNRRISIKLQDKKNPGKVQNYNKSGWKWLWKWLHKVSIIKHLSEHFMS